MTTKKNMIVLKKMVEVSVVLFEEDFEAITKEEGFQLEGEDPKELTSRLTEKTLVRRENLKARQRDTRETEIHGDTTITTITLASLGEGKNFWWTRDREDEDLKAWFEGDLSELLLDPFRTRKEMTEVQQAVVEAMTQEEREVFDAILRHGGDHTCAIMIAKN